MHYTHSHYLAYGPCRLPSLCPPAWHREELRPSVSSRVPVAQESQKGQRWKDKDSTGLMAYSDTLPTPLLTRSAWPSAASSEGQCLVSAESRSAKKLLSQQWHLMTLVPA